MASGPAILLLSKRRLFNTLRSVFALEVTIFAMKRINDTSTIAVSLKLIAPVLALLAVQTDVSRHTSLSPIGRPLNIAVGIGNLTTCDIIKAWERAGAPVPDRPFAASCPSV